MEINILPAAGVGNAVLLVGGGARVTIPPGNGFTIIVNPVELAAGGAVGAVGGAVGAVGGAVGGAFAGVAANEAIAAITANIVQHSVDDTLSTSQIMHMLRVDNTLEVHGDYLPEPPATGLFLCATEIQRRSDHHHYLNEPRYYTQPVQFGAGFVVLRHRRRVAAHPAHVQFQRVVCRRYLIDGDPRFLLHYLEQDEDDAYEEEAFPPIPLQPVVQLLL